MFFYKKIAVNAVHGQEELSGMLHSTRMRTLAGITPTLVELDKPTARHRLRRSICRATPRISELSVDKHPRGGKPCNIEIEQGGGAESEGQRGQE